MMASDDKGWLHCSGNLVQVGVKMVAVVALDMGIESWEGGGERAGFSPASPSCGFVTIG